jgi:hypothetical protein
MTYADTGASYEGLHSRRCAREMVRDFVPELNRVIRCMWAKWKIQSLKSASARALRMEKSPSMKVTGLHPPRGAILCSRTPGRLQLTGAQATMHYSLRCGPSSILDSLIVGYTIIHIRP